MTEREYDLCPQCAYSATPDEVLGEQRKHHWPHSLRCVRCGYTTETKQTWDDAKAAWNSSLVGVERASPPLRAWEEIARPLEATAAKLRELHQENFWTAKEARRGLDEWVARLDAWGDSALVRLEVSAHDRVLLAEFLRAILSSTAGQEWRDISSAKKVHAHEIAMTLCLVDGHDPDAEAPITEMCDDANMPVPWWMVYVEYAEALLDKFSILPAPPVAEPIVADKCEVKS